MFGSGGLELVLSLLLFLLDEVQGKQSLKELISEIMKTGKDLGYLGWLHRQDHATLARRIEKNFNDLIENQQLFGTELRACAQKILSVTETTNEKTFSYLKKLSAELSLPVLSNIPLDNHQYLGQPLMARARELIWLNNTEGDIVTTGQPGSGKTFLLFHYAKETNSKFLTTRNPEIAAKELLKECPRALIIDDAGESIELIKRLLHLRIENELKFRLVTVGWPFETDRLLKEMKLTGKSLLELDLLGRDVIADIVKKVFEERGLQAPVNVIREITNQSRGRPGLATTLALACLTEDFRKVMSGEQLVALLANSLCLSDSIRDESILASIAVGGKEGIRSDILADRLKMAIPDLMFYLKRLAPSGLITALAGDRLAVEPMALRRALLKSVFFNPDPNSARLPRSLYESLLQSSYNKDEALLTLIHSALIGAKFDLDWLQGMVAIGSSRKIWEAYAYINETTCKWALENSGQFFESIIDPGLKLVPEKTIPMLLDRAVSDKRELHSHPDAPLRKIADWILGAEPGQPEVLARRVNLMDIVTQWLEDGNDPETAYKAMIQSLRITSEKNETDPGLGRTVTFQISILSLKELDDIAKLWSKYLNAISRYGVSEWKTVVMAVEFWLHVDMHFPKSPPEAYWKKIKPVVSEIILALIPFSQRHNGFLRWCYIKAADVGIETERIPVSSEFLCLYPPDRITDDYKAEESERRSKVESLVASWKKESPFSILKRLVSYENEAKDMELTYPRLTPFACQLLARRRQFDESLIMECIKSGLPSDLVEMLLFELRSKNENMDSIVKHCLENDEYRLQGISYVLNGGAASLYCEIEQNLEEYTQLIEHLSLLEPLPLDIMKLLLNHSNPKVRLSAAISEFRIDRSNGPRDDIAQEWREAIVDGLSSTNSQTEIREIYGLKAMITYDKKIAFDILNRMVAGGSHALAAIDLRPIFPLIQELNMDERRQLILSSAEVEDSDLAKYLIGENLDLYELVLSNKNLKQHHLVPLRGCPLEGNWTEKALLAYKHGYMPEMISNAVLGMFVQWSGSESAHWQKWVDDFSVLASKDDPVVRAIGEAGLKWSSKRKDEAVEKERKEQTYGWPEE